MTAYPIPMGYTGKTETVEEIMARRERECKRSQTWDIDYVAPVEVSACGDVRLLDDCDAY